MCCGANTAPLVCQLPKRPCNIMMTSSAPLTSYPGERMGKNIPNHNLITPRSNHQECVQEFAPHPGP